MSLYKDLIIYIIYIRSIDTPLLHPLHRYRCSSYSLKDLYGRQTRLEHTTRGSPGRTVLGRQAAGRADSDIAPTPGGLSSRASPPTMPTNRPGMPKERRTSGGRSRPSRDRTPAYEALAAFSIKSGSREVLCTI